VEFPNIPTIDPNDLDIDFEGTVDLSNDGTLFSQSISATHSDRDLHVYTQIAAPTILVIVRGTINAVNIGSTVRELAVWRVKVKSGAITILKNGKVIGTMSLSVGAAAAEASPTFKIGSRGDGSPGSFGFVLPGLTYNHRLLVDGVKVLDAKIDDGFDLSPLARNTSTSGNGTVINPTIGMWSIGDDPESNPDLIQINSVITDVIKPITQSIG